MSAINGARPGIQALRRGLRLMGVVGARGRGISLAELGRVVGLHKSTVFHLVRTLVDEGFLVMDGGAKTYRLGPRLYQLARPGPSEQDLIDVAAPVLEALALETRESSHLAIREHDHAIVLVRGDSSRPLRVIERVGDRRALNCSAVGKVLAAGMAPEAQRALLSHLPLPRNTPRTITDRAAFERELRRVRARGYAVDDEEFALGVRCVGAPVFGPDGEVVAGIGVLAPAVRMTRSRVPEFAAHVLEAARRLSQRLAGEPEPAPRRSRQH